MTSKPKALVLSGDGINCEIETQAALNLAGFDSDVVHTSALLARPGRLLDSQLLVLPGGFSFGDEIASGKVLAIKLRERLAEVLQSFIEKGCVLMGICNGFQVLVQMGLLPYSQPGSPRIVSLARNSGGRFKNIWVRLIVDEDNPTKFFDGLKEVELPMRHGEGRIALAPSGGYDDVVRLHAPLRYDEDVNGSFDNIAALTNETGNVLGMMPHPEAFVRWTQHPAWTSLKLSKPELFDDSSYSGKTKKKKGNGDELPHGLVIFKNAFSMLE